MNPSNRVGYLRCEDLTDLSMPTLIANLLRFRYFITDYVICEIYSENESSLLSYIASIYSSTYSATDAPIYILIPQLLKTTYTPSPSDLLFSHFNTLEMLSLPIPEIPASILSMQINVNQKYRSAVMAGTFDHLHPGHLIFLTFAACSCDSLGVGITAASMVSHKNNIEVMQPWRIRARNVRTFLNLVKNSLEVDIFEINDPISKAGYVDYDAIILTTEVKAAIHQINEERAKNNLKPVEMCLIDLAQTGNIKISSSFIRQEIIEKSGGHYKKVKEIWNMVCIECVISQEMCEDWWEFISIQYSRSVRHYHTLAHLANCFNQFDRLSIAIYLSLFFHDLIYYPLKHPQLVSNEELSSQYFSVFLSESNLVEKYNYLTEYILSTIRHLPLSESEELKLFLDLDLSILASNSETYSIYAENIRKEYNWISEVDFKAGRKAILQKFLERNTLFFTEKYQEFEEIGRKNIQDEIDNKLTVS